MNTIYGFGNALVDVEIKLEEAQLKEVGIEKGSMKHISSQDLNMFLDLYSDQIFSKLPGGSIANSLHAANQNNATTHFSCSIGDDDYGKYFIDSFDDKRGSISFSKSKLSTGICLIFVTPDGQRTMAAHLGANLDLCPKSIELERLQSSEFLLFDNFSMSSPGGLETTKYALASAMKSKVCFGVSDVSLVSENLENLQWLSNIGIHLLFGNKNEMSLINNSINMHAENILVTYGAEGASYNDISVQAPEIEIVNSNGAGDALIGTFLTCLSTENDYTSLKKAVDYASEVCKSNGPRIK
ncbi:MAG: hypothetical protein EVA50_00630 [Gammaproteobacteria bacterium]|nr:MAG: hypothetical protein EVA50_00630 [Gammaproteobacteria bacterium]